MKAWKTSLIALAIAGCSALPAAAAGQGTAKEQAACRPDVRRFCSSIKGSDSSAFLGCLEAHRAKLSKPCLAVLESHGQ